MKQQINYARISSSFDNKTQVHAKSGSLFRYIRKEIAIVQPSANEAYTIAIFTRAENCKAIDACIGKLADNIIDYLQ